MKSLQLQEAKAHFSQMVKEVMADGPQEISLRGKSVVVLISKHEYEHLIKPKKSFVEFMRLSPLKGVHLKLKRNKSKTREVDL